MTDDAFDLKGLMDRLMQKVTVSDPDVEHILAPEELDMAGVAQAIKDGRIRKIGVMTGAGISVAAGIPDFRTPGTGLYSQLEKYQLSDPADIFTIDFFRKNPVPFNLLAKNLFPGNYKPTTAHYFIRLLHEKGLLVRNFTQNIDTLEREAGVPGDMLVEAHGSFSDARCIDCEFAHTMDFLRGIIMEDGIPKCTQCDGLVKPSIVFFGESLPERFFSCAKNDLPECDLLLVMGTSLVVFPFASLLSKVNDRCVRLLINREEVGKAGWMNSNGFLFGHPNNHRDVKYLGDIEDGIKKFAELLGWEDELTQLVNGHEQPSSSSPAVTVSESASDSPKEEKESSEK